MKKVSSKLLAAALAGTMAISVAGCASQKSETPAPSTDSTSENNGTTQTGEVTKPEKIKAILDTVVVPEDGQAQFAEEYQKQTGIELEIIQPPHQQYYEKVNLAFSSGDIPDVVEISEQPYVNYSLNGGFVPLDTMIENSEVLSQISDELYETKKVDGKIYSVPKEIGSGPITYVRKDWLDNLGLDVPTTWDEYYNMLTKFTFNDPDQNGENDTLGDTAPGLTDAKYLVNYYQDAHPDFVYKDGKWVDGMTEPEMKGALERLHQAYADKILDQEVFTNKTSTCRDKLYNGNVGVFTYWAGAWNVNLEENLKKVNPDASLVPIPAIAETKYIQRIPGGHSITVASKNPEGVFKWFLEYMHDGGEGQMLFTHGVDGVHYEKQDENYVKLPLLSDPSVAFKKTLLSPELSVVKWDDPFKQDPRVTNSLQIMLDTSRMDKFPPASETFAKANADLKALREETIAKAMIGDLTIDEALANYKEKSQQLGMDQMISEMNQ